MSMTTRVKELRQQSIETTETLSSERAGLMTAFYQQDLGPVSTPVRRALSFQYLMENKTICINDGELIVGEKGPRPKAAPTFPELCCHTLEDLDILDSREKIPFAVSEDTIKSYIEHIIPYWTDRTQRDKLFSTMTEEWKLA